MYLKQSTSVDVPIGPFVDNVDGNTPETALTITQPDIRIKKNGGNWAQKNAAQTLTHEENGWYELTLDATDTDTIGHLMVAIHESGALPVWREFHVLAANVYDSLFGAATDKLQVDTVEANSVAWTSGAITASSIAADAITAAKLAADVATEIRSVANGTADSGTTTTMVDAARTEATDDYWKGCWILFTSGTIAGQVRLITGFTASSDTITFAPATTAAVSTNTYEILPAGRVDVGAWLGTVCATPTVAGVPEVDVTHTNGVTVQNQDFTLASASGSTITLPTTYSSGTSLPDDDRYEWCALHVVSGSGEGLVLLITTASAGARQYNLIAAPPTPVDNTSKCIVLGSWRSNLEYWRGVQPNAISVGRVDASVGAVSASVITEIRSIVSGTADSGTTTTMVDAARTEADTDYWKGCWILFTSGTISGQVRLITGFTPGTDTITFAPATTQAVGTNTYEILPAGRADVGLWNGTAPNNLSSGRVDSHTGSMANDVITAAVIATDAIDADAIAASAIDAAAIATGAITAAKFAAGAIDAAALASDAATEIADAILTRNVSNVEGTAGEHTLCTVVLACLEYSTSGTTWTIKRTDGTTTHATKTLTTNASAEHITGVT